MKLLLLISRLRRSGPVIGLLTLSQRLLHLGITPRILALSEEYRDSMEEEFRSEGLRVDVLSCRRFDLIGAVSALRGFLRRVQPAIVHSTGIRSDVLLPLTRRWERSPALISTVQSRNEELSFSFGRCQGAMLARAWTQSLKRFDAVASLSLGVQHFLEDYRVPRDRLHLIYNGADLNRFRPPKGDERAAARAALGISPETVVVGRVGHLTELKGVDVLLAAFSRLRNDRTVLLSVGDGPEREHLTRLATQLGVQSRVLWAGRRTDVLPFLHAMDVFVMSSWTEGMPRALLEAGAAAVPAIVTDVSGCREVMTDCDGGVVVPPGDVEALSGALSFLIDIGESRRLLGARLRNRVESKFSADAMAKGYIGVYTSLFQQAGRAK